MSFVFKECGVSYHHMNTRIVGGSSVVTYSWPFIAYVTATYTTDFNIGSKLKLKLKSHILIELTPL